MIRGSVIYSSSRGQHASVHALPGLCRHQSRVPCLIGETWYLNERSLWIKWIDFCFVWVLLFRHALSSHFANFSPPFSPFSLSTPSPLVFSLSLLPLPLSHHWGAPVSHGTAGILNHHRLPSKSPRSDQEQTLRIFNKTNVSTNKKMINNGISTNKTGSTSA